MYYLQMSQIVGFNLRPTGETSLASMLDLGLTKFSEQYELILFSN